MRIKFVKCKCMMRFGKYLLILILTFVQCVTISCCDDGINPDDGGNTNNYEGECRSFRINPNVLDVGEMDITLHIKAPNGIVLERKGILVEEDGVDHLSIEVGLSDNTYRLLSIEYDNPDASDARFPRIRAGLGCKVSVKDGKATILDVYDENMKLYARQGERNSYTIAGDDDLIDLAKKVNSNNNHIDTSYTFYQECDIDMEWASFKVNKDYGWNPIGASNTTPFSSTYNGQGHKIIGLTINRPRTYGVGLFGYTIMAKIKNLTIEKADVRGDYATGAIIGMVTRPGGVKTATVIDSCSVNNSVIASTTYNVSDKGVDIGGMVGAVDASAMLAITNSTISDNDITATYNAGGFVGAGMGMSIISIANCSNSVDDVIKSEISGAGGIVGTADSLYVNACINNAPITGSTLMVNGGTYTIENEENGSVTIDVGVGTGGIAGGSGACYIINSINNAKVTGDEGVGGILGSTRAKGGKNEGDEAYLRDYAMIKYCGNTASIDGNIFVGGICGESNGAIYGTYNSATITGDSHVGGILGVAQIIAAHNNVNSGVVNVQSYDGGSFAGGIVGMADVVSIALCQNYAQVNSTGANTGGIIGMSGTTSVIHQCANFAKVSSSASGATGGIVGLLGKPSEWGLLNTAEVLLGTVDLVLAAWGPLAAYVEHGASLVTRIVVTVAKLVLELPTMALEGHFLAHSCSHIMHAEELSRIQADVDSKASSISKDVESEINTIRTTASNDIDTNEFDTSIIKGKYMEGINSTLEYYVKEEGGEYYNNSINTKRDALTDEVEDYSRKKDLAHTVLSGIALGASVIFTAGAVISSFITGGATAVAVFVGLNAVTSLMSGAVTISKASTEFENNSVIVSQCVNAAQVTASSSELTGALVGELSDFGVVRDCLNTANGNGSGAHFVGTLGDRACLDRCVSLGTDYDGFVVKSKQMVDYNNLYIYHPNFDKTIKDFSHSVWYLCASDVDSAEIYDGLDIGDGENLWTIPTSDNAFPIPFFSEMQEKSSK